MKKHKVKIPEGYEVESTITNAPPTSITINLKPIEKQFPKTWEEYCCHHEFPFWLSDDQEDFYPPIPNKHKALGRLEILKDHYNDRWKADWKEQGLKYSIGICKNEIKIGQASSWSDILSFKTEGLRDKFLSNFRGLIETAKPLL